MLIFQLHKNDTSLFPFFLYFGDCWWTGALQPDTLLQCPGKKKQIAAQNLLKPQGYEWSCRIMKQHSESVCVFTLLLLFDFHSQHPAALGERTLNNLQYPPIINQIKKPTSIGQKFTCKVKKKIVIQCHFSWLHLLPFTPDSPRLNTWGSCDVVPIHGRMGTRTAVKNYAVTPDWLLHVESSRKKFTHDIICVFFFHLNQTNVNNFKSHLLFCCFVFSVSSWTRRQTSLQFHTPLTVL